MRELELMSTLGCHLCEVATAVLIPVVNPAEFSVYEVDIAESEDLLDRYALRIPVLVDVKSQKELEWPFDEQTVQQFLLALAKEG